MPKKLSQQVIKHCAKVRKAAGYTQREAAEEMGVAHGTVEQWELGARIPTKENQKLWLAWTKKQAKRLGWQ